MAAGTNRPSHLAGAAGRAASYPARRAARAWRGELEEAIEAMLASPEAARIIGQALSGPLPERVVEAWVRTGVTARVSAQLRSSGEIDRIVEQVLASPKLGDAIGRAIDQAAVRRAIADAISSPEVIAALRRTGGSLGERMLLDARAALRRADRRLARGPAAPGHAGLCTRAVAAGIDLVGAFLAYTSVIGIAALIGALVGGLRPEWLVAALLSAGGSLAFAAYLVVSWSAAGRTIGMWLVDLRLVTIAGDRPAVARSILRVVVAAIAAVPLMLGYLTIPLDRRRRSVPDMVAGTFVLYDDAAHDRPAAER